ncbi:MAG: hypothetical protein J6T64_03545 [Bacteroidaceae bacterium]|nr:hypothetical protein [Bacteroidaceae bacterium]
MRKSRLSAFLLGAALLFPCLNVSAQYVDPETGVAYTAIDGTKAGNEGFADASDGKTDTKYGTRDMPNFVTIEASDPVFLTGYTIITANDNASYTGRNPLDWTLEGSNNKENWDTLQVVTNDNVLEDVNFTPFDFQLEAPSKTYKYFRFTVHATKEEGAYMQYSELHLWGKPYYTINNADDLQTFAQRVNDGDEILGGLLTADIDLAGVEWIPVGNGDHKYAGHFNGQFHRIKNMTTRDVKEQGLFGVAAAANIENVIIDKSCVLKTTSSCSAALIGCVNGSGTLTITGCRNEADVEGGAANNSAFVGCNYSSGALKVIIKNCVNTGNVSGGWENGIFSGWFANAGKVISSYNTGKLTNGDGNNSLGRGIGDGDYTASFDLNEENFRKAVNTLEGFTNEWFATGALTYALNGDQKEINWYQTLGEDAEPTLDATHAVVYVVGEFECDGVTAKGDISYSNTDGKKVDPHTFVNGICTKCGAADETYCDLVDGYYEVGNANQLQWISALVNGGRNDVNVKLISDIDMKDVAWTPIGTSKFFYEGTFDGQLHRIKNLVINDAEASETGLFKVLGPAVVRNLIIDSSCSFKSNTKTAAFAGYCNGEGTLLIENCGNEANVEGITATNGNNAAFIGCNYSSGALQVIIKNCYNTGNISGGNENGIFSGWFANNGKVISSWNTGKLDDGDGSNSLGRGIGDGDYTNTFDLNEENMKKEAYTLANFTNDWFKSGALTYALNRDLGTDAWYQTLGSDDYPTFDPSHSKVYAIGTLSCNGTPKEGTTYSNTEGELKRDNHEFENGICIHCGASNDDFCPLVDDYYVISTAEQLAWFAGKVNNGSGTANAKLTADIDLADVTWTPIGNTSTKFQGKFDGQEHRILNLVVDLPDDDYVGFFGIIGDGADIRNLIIDSSCSFTGAAYVAGVAGGSNGSGNAYFTNVGNEATVIGGANNAAGIIGVSMSSACHFFIDNCYNMGEVTGVNESAAISGWIGDASTISNSYNGNYAIVGVDGTKTFARFGSDPTFTNCFDILASQENIGKFDEEDLYSGALAYALNGKSTENPRWFQTIGVDLYPVPFASHGIVYPAGSLYCDGTPKDDFHFTNTEGQLERDEHEYENGICIHCGIAQEGYLEKGEDGLYHIEDGDQFVTFAGIVQLDGTASAVLEDDINLSGIEWRPIGTVASPFQGKFDGQNHSIENMYVEGDEYVGLFGVIADGADIRNFIVTSSCDVVGTRYVGGIVGGSNGGGKIYLTNIGNEANVTAADKNAAGLIGVSMGTACAFIIENCYNMGDVIGSLESAAFSGWCGTGSEIRNCFNTGFISGADDDGLKNLWRNDGTKTENIFTFVESNQGRVLEEEALTSGELAFLLNGMVSGGENWYQTLGEDDYPLPFSEGHAKVYATGELRCDGTPSGDVAFSNEENGEVIQRDHEFDEESGICHVCGTYGISTAQQLLSFSFDVQNGEAQKASVILLSDIDLADVDFEPIGYYEGQDDSSGNLDLSIPYCGVFDGQGHRIYNMVLDQPDRANLGFFGVIGGGAVIKNVTIDKSCFVNGSRYSAGLVGGISKSGDVKILNCGNEADVTVANQNAGGVLGVNFGNRGALEMVNCYNTGNITGYNESAGLSGWLGNATIANCYNSGVIVGVDGDKTLARFASLSATNCYDMGGQSGTTAFSDNMLASGELCYLLSGSENNLESVWRQNIGEDGHPVLDPDHKVVVFRGGKFTNDLSGIEIVEEKAPVAVPEGIFTLRGERINELRQGINIVRMSDGSVRKVLIK